METRNQNSLVLQKLQDLTTCFFRDLQLHHPHLKNSLLRDLKTIISRSDHEGVSFFTSTLPKLSKALLRALENGSFACPTGFAKQKGTELPRFLGGFLKEVLNSDGTLRDSLDQCILTDILQLCGLFYKVELPYTTESVKKVIDNFKEVDYELGSLQFLHDSILESAARLVEKVLRGFNPKEITPQHGPGSVATGERGAKKWTFRTKYKALHKVYPYYEYFVSSRESLLRSISEYRSMDTYESGCAKVHLVQKDSRGPRLISMEPLEYQFIQQGIARNLVKQIELKSPITRGKVNFTDQTINQCLAKENSLTRRYSTLDMKEASDRVSLRLVQHVFSKRRDVLRALMATRTTHTKLPGGEIVQLNKFAPMGSALCFPVEALIFWALAESIRRRVGIKGCIYVYGDDIIVPKRLTPFLFKLFPRYGLKFNEDKCFTNGHFRESCGMDAYRGIQCAPIRMRHLLPVSRKETTSIVSSVAFSNFLWEKGYWNAAEFVKTCIDKLLPIRILKSPRVYFGGLSYSSFTQKCVGWEGGVKVRFDNSLQKHHIQSYLVHDCTDKKSVWTAEGRLFASLVGKYDRRFTVPHAVSLKLRWSSFETKVA